MLYYASAVIVGLDVLFALGALYALGVLGSMLRGSISREDRRWGAGVWAFGAMYACHVTFPAWLWSEQMWWWATLAATCGVALSLAGGWVVARAIEAAARP